MVLRRKVGLKTRSKGCMRRMMFIDRSQFQFNLLSTNKTICYRKQQQKPD